MKKLRSLKKGLAILLTIAMVAGLMPGVGSIKVSAAESESGTISNTVTFTATAGTDAIFDEYCNHLIDGNVASDWYIYTSTTESAYIIFEASAPIFVNGYTIVTSTER